MCFVDRKKLPFAGYSVVKDRSEGLRPSDSLTRSLARRFRRLAPFASGLRLAAQPEPTRRRRVTAPGDSKLFPPRIAKAGLPTVAHERSLATVSEGWWRIPGSNR